MTAPGTLAVAILTPPEESALPTPAKRPLKISEQIASPETARRPDRKSPAASFRMLTLRKIPVSVIISMPLGPESPSAEFYQKLLLYLITKLQILHCRIA